jgi:hypothetical protein
MKTQIDISARDGKIAVVGPFSTENNTNWRELGGKFSGGAWLLPDNKTTRETLVELFGAKSELVEVEVPASRARGDAIVQIGGYVLAQRRDRDSRVCMPDGVSLLRGRFSASGGSRKSPRVEIDKDVVFRLVCRSSFAEANHLKLAEEAAPIIEV